MVFSPTPENLAQVRLLIELNYTSGQIAERFNCSVQCIRGWRRRINIENDGGPPAIDGRKIRVQKNKLCDGLLELTETYLKEHPFTTVKAVINILQLNIHYITLLRLLNKRKKLKFRRPAKKAQLTQGEAARRLEYAHEYVNRPNAFWRRTF